MRLLLLLLAATVCPAALAAPPAWVLDVKPARRIEATMTSEVRPPAGVKVRESVFVAAEAPELPSQTQVSTRITPAGGVVKEKATGRNLVVARLPGSPEGRTVTVRYQATLMARKLVRAGDGPAERVAPLSAAERKRWLAASRHVDHGDAEFRRWLEAARLLRGKDEDDVAFARRVYRHLLTAYRYEILPDQDHRVSRLCRAGKTDCAGLSTLFVSTLRANGVPARHLVGHNAVSGRRGAATATLDMQYHVRAEFFADSVGWVPVDLTLGLQTPGDAHFGNDAGDHLTQHLDSDLVMDLKLFRGARPVELSFLQGIGHWWAGEGSGVMQVVEDWQVKDLPLKGKP